MVHKSSILLVPLWFGVTASHRSSAPKPGLHSSFVQIRELGLSECLQTGGSPQIRLVVPPLSSLGGGGGGNLLLFCQNPHKHQDARSAHLFHFSNISRPSAPPKKKRPTVLVGKMPFLTLFMCRAASCEGCISPLHTRITKICSDW